jgi:uncharacterized OsmC-like protein
MTSKVIYTGNLRTTATHLKSGTQIETDAPLDNKGKGERFSPTDLVATALASCMLTIMGIKARDHGINLEGTTCSIEKIMASNPRRIGEIKIDMTVKGQEGYSEKEKNILQNAALTCPVYKSLNDALIKTVAFHWE